jgi:2-keto-4-pentenoate hydratase/2-oxohepta-3-ene-1,7-dioic acid hydratase in catechol pathway
MKLVTFTHQGATRVGVMQDNVVADVCASSSIPREMIGFLKAGRDALDAARKALSTAPKISVGEVKLEAPVQRPPEFLAVGLNYADHIAETGMAKPTFPIFFNKQSSCVNGPYDSIHLPRASEALDYEGELGFVIGRRCRHVPRDRAHEVIAGHMIVNDVSVRDWQRRAPTMTLGKSFDTHGPTGPWIVTPDEIGDPHTLDLKTLVNGEVRQHSMLDQMIWNVPEIIAELSTLYALRAGDLVFMGTPAGVAALQPGDAFDARIGAVAERHGVIAS